MLLFPYANLASVPDREAKDVVAEEIALKGAIAQVRDEFGQTRERMAGVLLADVKALLDVYMMLLGDDRLVQDTVERIRAGNWAPGALRATITEYARVFEQMDDPYLRARAEDIRGLGERILVHLQKAPREPAQYPDRCVLVGDEISVAGLAAVPVGKIAGIVCMRGSGFSHTAVFARALAIPSVMGVGDLPLDALEGRSIVVDGYQGRIFIQPSHAILEEYQQLARQEEKLSAELRVLRDVAAETRDGVRVPLHINAGLLSDIVPSLESGAEGIGLYRTEFAFMERESFPGEEEQCQIYRRVLESFAPRPVTMRTLDVGGDKGLPYFPIDEGNPFLGWRGIRITLDHPEIFLTQLRAMLRASAGLDNLRVMFPMISKVNELDEALALMERARRELLATGLVLAPRCVGVMIEVPSAVYLTRHLASRVDFLSIGTNDLTQYLLAVDRNNPRVARLYDHLHPAVINAVRHVIEEAHSLGKPVTVCGEMASDPAAVLLLLGMGIDGLSMSYASLPRIKWTIRSFSRQQARELLDEVRGVADERAVYRLLASAFEEAGLGTLVRGA